MSKDSKQDDGELFDTETPEGDLDAESNTDDDQKDQEDDSKSESEKGEEKEEKLDLDDEGGDKTEKDSKKSVAEENRQKQISVWEDKIDSGEKDISEAPKWIQKKLNLKEKEEEVAVDLDAIVDKKLAEKQEKRDFKSLKDQLEAMPLTIAQKKELNAEFADLKGGMPKSKALATAIKIAGIDMEQKDKRRADMAVGKAGNYSKPTAGKVEKGTPYSEVRKNLPEKDRMAYLKKMTQDPMVMSD